MKRTIRHLHIYYILLPLLLGCILSLMTAFPVYAVEKSGSCGDELTWTLSDGTLTISGSGEMMDYADGALAPWFGVAGEIRTINLSDKMTSIGDYAFFGCKNVTSISIPSSVTEIGECAFGQCRGLLWLDLGTGVQILGEGAFQECEALISVSFPESLTEIGEKAFYRCYSLTTVTVPSTVTSVGTSAFSYCTGLVRATINAPLEELPGWTFYGCTSLADISLASSIVSAGEYAFLFCDGLNGIYTQSGDINTVHKLETSIYEKDGAPREGLIKAYEMPVSSTAVADDGKVYSQSTVSESEAAVISVKTETDYSSGQNVTSKMIEAVIKTADGWTSVADMAAKEQSSANLESIMVDIYPDSTTVESEHLELFVGKPVILRIIAENGAFWKIEMSKMTLSSFTGQYALSEMATEQLEEETVSENITAEETTGLEQIQPEETELADDSGITYVPYDAESVESAGAADGESHLTDEEGTTYYVTKRSSKWGITGKQFAIYVGLWIASAVLIVAVVMLSMNQIKKSKEQYEELRKQGEAEDAAAEEALQVEILKEMLGKGGKK